MTVTGPGVRIPLSPLEAKKETFQSLQKRLKFTENPAIKQGFFFYILKRNIDLIKNSPEQYYLLIIPEYGTALNHIPLKNIASYLGIPQQALSRIRQRIFKPGFIVLYLLVWKFVL
ncbi:hypothetical protein J0383_04700 [Flavobacterium endoglycinae]|uniref:Uncharacterized protein n=1 Tax=Flavobacterium endoglycinae TaxID=2816357 RepID=A0ABX7QHK8_9FLAO|nr:hypothetical protein [Flavobacterium endoglycinae]QSW90119.1 hypothetical protein J0383_04700 [Flavobacterium endoglycinae]